MQMVYVIEDVLPLIRADVGREFMVQETSCQWWMQGDE